MSLIRSSAIIGLFTALSVAFNFASNVVIAQAFGAAPSMDAYLAAIAVPTYFVTVATGMLGIAFVPIFAEYRKADPVKAWQTVNAVVNLAVLVSTACIIFGGLFSRGLLRVFAPGFSGPLLSYAVLILRCYLPVVAITILNELLASVYYSNDIIITPLLNRIIAPCITMAAVWLLGAKVDVMSLVIASLLGAAIQCLVLIYGIATNPAFSYTFKAELLNEGARKVIRLMVPLGAGMLLYKITPVFDRMIVSRLPAGSISCLNYATKIQLTIVMLMTSSVSLAIFPFMARTVAEGDLATLKATMAQVIRVLFFLAVPVAVFMIVFGEPIICLVFQRGAFTREIAHVVYQCFAIYMVSLPWVVISGVVSQGFYVLKDTKTTAIVGVFEVLFYICLCMALVSHLGVFVVPLVYGIYFLVSLLALSLIFRHRLGLGGGFRLVSACFAHLGVALLVGLGAWGFRLLVGTSRAGSVVGCFLAILGYLGLSKVFNIKEANYIWRKLDALCH